MGGWIKTMVKTVITATAVATALTYFNGMVSSKVPFVGQYVPELELVGGVVLMYVFKSKDNPLIRGAITGMIIAGAINTTQKYFGKK